MEIVKLKVEIVKLKIGADRFTLDRELATDVVAIVGRRGRGKTTTAVVMVEELHRAGGRFCVADPVGVWWGLKSSKDGKKAGLPVVVMGGDHGDVPLEETAGRVIADFVAEPSSPSVILDFLHFRKAQMTRFMIDFLEELYHKNRSALHLVLDEADKFAPQRVTGDVARLVGAAEDIVKMGRARGILPILITQRPAALNKNVLTQAGLFIAHALTGPQDKKAVDEWIRENAEEGDREKFHSSIAGLPRGVAWFWQPEAEIFQKVRVRDRKTFDSSATPASGRAKAAPKVQAEVNLDALKRRISSTIEKAKANDPKELKRKIAELERELQKKPVAEVKKERIEVSVLSKKELVRLDANVSTLGKYTSVLRDELGALSKTLATIATAIARVSINGHGNTARERPRTAPSTTRRPTTTSANTLRQNDNADDTGLKPRHRDILRALAEFEQMGMPVVPNQRIATAIGLALTGSFNNYLSALSTRGFIERTGDGKAQLTDAGRAAAGDVQLRTHGEIMELWLPKLSPRHREILALLVHAYPEYLSNVDIAQTLGLQNTGSFNNYLSKLSTLGLIVRSHGSARASEHLYP